MSRRFAGLVLGLVVRAWLATLRLRVVVDPALTTPAARTTPWILCFFHGTQAALLAWPRRRRTVVLVSHSADGALQAGSLAAQGMEIVRGSSSRGGARGLAAVVRRLRGGERDAAFAVDGPRGPYGVAKEGAIVAARATGALLVPMGAEIARAYVLTRTWDRFALPLPFTRVVVRLGAPVDAVAVDVRSNLERAIARLNGVAALERSAEREQGERGERAEEEAVTCGVQS